MRENRRSGGGALTPLPRRAARAAMAAVLAAGMCVPAGALAFAEDGEETQAASPTVTPSVDGYDGGGTTELTVQLPPSVTSDPVEIDPEDPNANPIGEDGLGGNIAFQVPTKVNFVAKADGTLISPSEGAVYVKNYSLFADHVSSLKVAPVSGWNFVEEGGAGQTPNAVDLKLGPAGDQLSAAQYTDKKKIADAGKWNMAPSVRSLKEEEKEGESTDPDRLNISMSGHVSNVSADLSTAQKFGTVTWYITPGAVAEGIDYSKAVKVSDNVASAQDLELVKNLSACIEKMTGANGTEIPGLYVSYPLGNGSGRVASNVWDPTSDYSAEGVVPSAVSSTWELAGGYDKPEASFSIETDAEDINKITVCVSPLNGAELWVDRAALDAFVKGGSSS